MEDGFQIFIALPTDDVCTVRCLTNDMKIYELKSQVELKTGIPGDIQHLYFMNKELYDEYKLGELKVKQGCIVRVRLDSTWSSLFEACWRGDIYDVFQNGVQFLDEKEFQGYNIGLWNRLVIQRATSALFIASHRGFLGLVIELLNHGAADINGKTRFGRTSLHVASYQGFVGCVSLLLSEGALSNQVDFNGKTPLFLASENGHMYCERRLWLYQMSLKGHANSRKTPVDTRTTGETTADLQARFHQSRDSGKVLRLNGNKARLSDEENRRENEKINFHLPRVQTSNGRHNMDSTPVPEQKEFIRPQFPFVQIAEKYRIEFRDLNKSNLPHMGDAAGSGNQRPHTAPGPSRLKNTRKEPKHKSVLEQVEEANALRQEAQDENVTTDGQETKKNAPVTALLGSSAAVSEMKTSKKEANTNNAAFSLTTYENTEERPQSSRASSKRHLDLVFSKSRERSKSDEGQTLQLNVNPTENTPTPHDESAEGPDFMDVSEHAYTHRKPAQTFDTWLERKRTQGQLRPATAPGPDHSKLGKSIDPEAFKVWLNKKRYHHSRSSSESSNVGPKKTYISSGMPFEKWLEEKKKMAGRDDDNHVTESHENRKTPRVVLAGKTYEKWLNEKLSQVQSQSKENDEDDSCKNGEKRGKTFEMWLVEKHNQKQIEMIHKATTEKAQQRRQELEQYQKYFNPNSRTFDEWMSIKRQEHALGRVRAENEQKSEEITSEEKKKDANLIFDIWLTMKLVNEMEVEKNMYQEMKEKWERREKQGATLRRAIHMNKLFKKSNQQTCFKLPSCGIDNNDEIMECIEES